MLAAESGLRPSEVNSEERESMAWVITRLCQDCVDVSCVEVCPVDCIVEYKGDDKTTWKNQLYIDPEECINCGVCEPECPWEAIFEDEEFYQEGVYVSNRDDARGLQSAAATLYHGK